MNCFSYTSREDDAAKRVSSSKKTQSRNVVLEENTIAQVHVDGCFLARTSERAVLFECLPDRPKVGPPPATDGAKRLLAKAVAEDWILRLLGLLEDHMVSLGASFDLAQFDPRAAALRDEKAEERAAKKHARHDSNGPDLKDPNAITPRKWEDWVSRACKGEPGEDAAREYPTVRPRKTLHCTP